MPMGLAMASSEIAPHARVRGPPLLRDPAAADSRMRRSFRAGAVPGTPCTVGWRLCWCGSAKPQADRLKIQVDSSEAEGSNR